MLTTCHKQHSRKAGSQKTLSKYFPMCTLKIAPERLDQLQCCTAQDQAQQTLKITILAGSPEEREQCQLTSQSTGIIEKTLHNRVILESNRVFIPKDMRPEVVLRIHSSRLRVEACLRKARDSVFWPNMNAEVKETVKQCSQCNDSKPRIRKTLCSHHIPDRPWGRIAVDQFTS